MEYSSGWLEVLSLHYVTRLSARAEALRWGKVAVIRSSGGLPVKIQGHPGLPDVGLLLADRADDATNVKAALSLVANAVCTCLPVKDEIVSNFSLHTSVSTRCPGSGP